MCFFFNIEIIDIEIESEKEVDDDFNIVFFMEGIFYLVDQIQIFFNILELGSLLKQKVL